MSQQQATIFAQNAETIGPVTTTTPLLFVIGNKNTHMFARHARVNRNAAHAINGFRSTSFERTATYAATANLYCAHTAALYTRVDSNQISSGIFFLITEMSCAVNAATKGGDLQRGPMQQRYKRSNAKLVITCAH